MYVPNFKNSIRHLHVLYFLLLHFVLSLTHEFLIWHRSWKGSILTIFWMNGHKTLYIVVQILLPMPMPTLKFMRHKLEIRMTTILIRQMSIWSELCVILEKLLSLRQHILRRFFLITAIILCGLVNYVVN